MNLLYLQRRNIMRLQEVYAICQDVQSSWCDLAFEEKKGPGNITYYKLSNADRVRRLLHDLEQITSLSANIEEVRKTSVGFTQPTIEINVDLRAKNNLTAEYHQLLNKVITITQLFESLNYSQNVNGIDIKMPPQLSLSDFSKCTKDLNTIFSNCPLFSQTDNTITLSAVDVGSIWLSFVNMIINCLHERLKKETVNLSLENAILCLRVVHALGA